MAYKRKQTNWRDWIDERNQRRKQEYISEPARLKSDYNREKAGTKGYFGRILLEMLQNADDAGLDRSEPVEILIKQSGNHLHIANTGSPFDEAGIESLIISDNSPKQFRSDSIGYKGLGFRSILNWTASVAILSGNLSIGFSDTFANEFLENIRQKSSKLDSKVDEWEKKGLENPIATLSVPRWIDPDTISDSDLRESYETGIQLREEGYDTVICIPLDSRKNVESIQREIDELYPEITLFLQNTSRVEIDTPDSNDVWERHVDDSQETVTVASHNGSSTTWNITEQKGTLPERLLDEDTQKKYYGIKVAVPTDGDLEETVERNLSVFFPTKVSFPFPVLAHATFEVTDDRNHLLTTETNQFVADKLAATMASAVDSLRTITHDPWFPLKTISADRRVDRTLDNLSPGDESSTFEALLRSKVEHLEIVPVHGREMKAPIDVSRIPTDLDGLLNPEVFGDIALYPNDKKLHNQLAALGVKQLEFDELCTRLNKVSPSLSGEDRTEIIYRLVTKDLVGSESIPDLLIDGDGNIIPADSKAFIPPSEEKISLPEWVPQHIIDDDLVSSLRKRFEVTSNRELANTLDPFPVYQYNLRRLVESTIAEANRRVSDEPEKELDWLKRMLQAVWNLRSSSENTVSIDNDSKVHLPTRTGDSRSADELYIGKGYPDGDLLERLYKPISEECFVAGPETFDVVDDTSTFQEFLCWLGVAKRPRVVELEDPRSDYAEYILQDEGFPTEFEEVTIESMDEFRRSSSQHNLQNVSTIDRLDEILQQADPHAIIGLLHEMGSEFDTWRQEGDDTAVFGFKRNRMQYYRELAKGSLPAYPIWLIQTTEWLPVKQGRTLRPTRCNLSSDEMNLSPVIGYPAIDPQDTLFDRLSMDDLSIRMALQRAGVTQDLEDLSWEAFYDILFELPEIDPNGEVASRIYSLIASKKGEPDGNQYDRFRESGQMLGKHEGKIDYFPVNELRLPESDSLPKTIVEKYPILQIAKKSRSPRVENLFGVKTLAGDDIEIKPTEFHAHNRASEFQREVERLKPYILALRMGTTQQTTARSVIQDLEFKLCESFQAVASVNGEELELELEPDTFLMVNSTVYVVPKPFSTTRTLDEESLASLVGEVFSTALDRNVRNETYILSMATDIDKTFSILTGEDVRKIQNAREQLDREEDDRHSFEPPELDPDRSQPADASSSDDDSSSDVDREESTSTSEDIGQGEHIDIGSISVGDGEYEVTEKRNISVRRLEGTPSKSTQQRSRRVADGSRAEKICMRFEQEEGRVPVDVSHIHGSESYGCDIISFSSEDRKEQFLEQYDPTLVNRYIEVKARTSDKGSILLKGNQLEAAKEQRERFFLYRAYERVEDGSSYELLVLNDPTAVSEAIQPQISVNPFQTAESECYELNLQKSRNTENKN